MLRLLQFFIFSTLLFSYYVLPAQIYYSDTTFQTLQVKQNKGNIHSIIIQPDQKILLNGEMNFINNQTAQGAVRLNPDGSLDTTFKPPVDAKYTQILALRQDGKILSGIISENAVSQRVIKLLLLKNDGRLDSTIQTTVRSDYPARNGFYVLKDNKMLIGSNYFDNGTYKGKLSQLHPDGSNETAFSANYEGSIEIMWVISVLLQPDGKILLFGDIKYKNTPIRTHVVRLNPDGSLDTSFNSVYYGQAFAIQLQTDGKILIGRNGHILNGTGIIRLNPDGSEDNTFKASTQDVPYSVHSMALQTDGKIVIGKLFSTIPGTMYAKNQVVRLNTDGSLDATFVTGEGAELAITFLAVQTDGDIIAGGSFSTYNNKIQPALVRLHGRDGSLDTSFQCKVESSGYISKVTKQTDGKLIIRGFFDTANNLLKRHITRLLSDGNVDTTFTFGKGVNNPENFASFNLHAMAVSPDNKIVVAGESGLTNEQRKPLILNLNEDGSVKSTFQLPAPSPMFISTIAIQPDLKILVGKHTDFSGLPYLFRLNADGTEDQTFNIGAGFNYGVRQVLLQADGKIIVNGSFTSFNGIPAGHIFRLNADGTADNLFKATGIPTGDIGNMQLLEDGKILVGGKFTTFNNQAVNHMVRLNTDGSLDNTFVSPLSANDLINYISLQPDGRMLLTGRFSSLGKPLIRVNTNGSIDTSLFMITELSKPYYNAIWADEDEDKIFALSADHLERFTRMLTQAITFDALPDKEANDSSLLLSLLKPVQDYP